MCLFSWDYRINNNENGDENEKKRTNRFDINRASSRYGHKYSKYKICLSLIFICIKQHISNMWSSVHEKIKQQWGWVEKKRCLLKKACTSFKGF